jgi:hypothetical protein
MAMGDTFHVSSRIHDNLTDRVDVGPLYNGLKSQSLSTIVEFTAQILEVLVAWPISTTQTLSPPTQTLSS